MTVGSVMRPITDRHNVSRAKLAYILDSTAAPVTLILMAIVILVVRKSGAADISKVKE
jgi:Na+/H+ antiporter NhaC